MRDDLVVMWSLIRLIGLFGAIFSPYYFYGGLGAVPLWGRGAVLQVRTLSQYRVGSSGNAPEAENSLILLKVSKTIFPIGQLILALIL